MAASEIPLFPLHTVLFPGMPLPLRVFEPRYHDMIGKCLEVDRQFGVVLIRSGVEVGGPADPFEVGTMAEIVEVQRQNDGRMNLLTIGRQRFRILEVTQREPYLQAVVEAMADGAVPGNALAGSVARLFREYVDFFRQGTREPNEIELPEEPVRLSYFIGAALQIPVQELQALLELPGATERLNEEALVLQRELRFLRALGASGHRAPQTRFSPN